MEASILRCTLIALSLFVSTGASYQTRNFEVTASTPEIAEQIGQAAEEYRRELATFWLGQPLPNWSRPCKLRVRHGTMGAGGETTFQFVGGEVINWKMYVQGSLERILDSVLPHEVNHTIFACHFRRPLPRWADEGAATLFEHRSEQMHQLDLLGQVIRSDREFLPLPKLLNMKEYPKGRRPMLILYAEGYALADFLVQQGGRTQYLKFLADGERLGWERAIEKNYDHAGVESLQNNWKAWVVAGMPKLDLPKGQMLASTSNGGSEAGGSLLNDASIEPVVRSQSPDRDESAAGAGQRQSGRDSKFVLAVSQSKPRMKTASRERRSPIFVEVSSQSTESADRVGGNSLFQEVQGQPTAVRGRRASFEAPAPRTRTSGRTGHVVPASGSVSNEKFRPAAGSRDPRFESTTDRRDRQDQRSGFDFSGTHFPREHKLEASSTPQWAGFPGQKEFF
jgi:hypothetical protein